ncbi:protein kinase domain-containing protein [Streptantibioticus ferralitis]|uniref:non-specific serine/threonine protein kinase n=1 Tax=Streptantibioticus ferralitis TaxID=236510 RepID=A0ABT5Z6M3_9ACTN|nr:protein kinase [Streptantibioticus ferralitis]MDF2259458.1 protein kinase [Streptantibioticus ferralitis]
MGRDAMLGDRYELVERLGHGGMGSVHRAVDHRLRRTVAIKLMSAELAHHAESRARFQREAHAVAALNHPAVATIHDVGEEPDAEGPRPFLVMEYVAGSTLAEALRDGPLPVTRAITLACEVLDALQHSHQHGIVHRDIKPSNIMLTGPTAVKVLDFGIAKALTEAATRLTGSGAAPGTPAYLSPEQISGTEIDHRADLYAMGCLLYELLTGAPPFRADSPFAVMHQHVFAEPVPVSQVRAEIPPAVEAVITRALCKDPADRFADAAAMRAALADTLTAAPVPATAAPPQPAPAASDALDASDAPAASAVQAPPAAEAVPAASAEVRPRAAAAGHRLRAALRPSTAAALALAGCVLSFLCARGAAVQTDHFGQVAIFAGLLGLVTLPVSPRLSCVVAWGPVAEAVSVNSELRRANTGWDSSYVSIALMLAMAAAVCFVSAARNRDGGPFAVVAFWFSATAATWYFLDDLHKLAVFYLLLAAVTSAAGVQELTGWYRRRTADRRADGGWRTAPPDPAARLPHRTPAGG